MLSCHFLLPEWQRHFLSRFMCFVFHYCKTKPSFLAVYVHILWLWNKMKFSVKFESWPAVFLSFSLAGVKHWHYCDMMCTLALLSLGRPNNMYNFKFSGPGKHRAESKATSIANCVQLWILACLFYPVSSWLKRESQMTLRQAPGDNSASYSSSSDPIRAQRQTILWRSSRSLGTVITSKYACHAVGPL